VTVSITFRIAHGWDASVSCVIGVLYHESITEFRQFACERPSAPAMLSSGTEHLEGVANAAKDHKRDRRSAGPKSAPAEQ
jgi:hypothetical protein